MQLSLEDICRIIGSRPEALSTTDLSDAHIDSLLTDSRSLAEPRNTLFFAIPTATNTGVNYIPELYNKGVRYFLIPSDTPPCRQKQLKSECPEAIFLTAPDAVEALQKIAGRRNHAGGEMVAITGSKGKTTLKEWIFQLLEPLREIARSPRSYNSQIGVPLSLWEISSKTDLTIIEAGVSRTGEMARLAECISPDCVIITDMTREHDSGFADHSAKVKEKVSLAAYPGVKKVIFCQDDKDVATEVATLPADRDFISWSMANPDSPTPDDPPPHNHKADLIIENITPVCDSSEPQKRIGSRIRYRYRGNAPQELQLGLSEMSDLRNAIYALTFLLAEGISDNDLLNRRFSRLHPIVTRLSVSDGGNGCNVVYDSYTSDYSSLVPAVDFIMRRKVPGQRAIVILSDLRHEARSEEDDYRYIASLMQRRGIDLFVGVGPRLQKYARLFRASDRFFADTADLLAELRANPTSDAVILLKGAPEFDFAAVKEVLEERTHETTLEVNLDSIIKNYNYFKSHLPASTGMIAMVKASGYGAGSYEIAKTLQDAGAAYLAVAVLDEGLALRHRGITMPIMVMNPRVADYREMFIHHLQPEIYSFQMLRDVIAQAARYEVSDYPIHLKLDTGMHRMGFIESELPEVISILSGQKNVKISTVFSHLATADCPDLDDYTEMQLATFDRASGYLLANCGYPFKRHVLNSAGILRFPQYHYDFARLGIGLYGVNTLPPEMESPLAIVSSLKTVIINLREWKAGESVGYARRGLLTRDSRIATIPIGYADGMSRAFGNGNVKVLVNGLEAPTVGNICMDACMIDVTGIDCNIGDSVEIFGENTPIGRLSDALDTIPYEILTSVSPRVKRVYFRE